jgi:hypothetical protein
MDGLVDGNVKAFYVFGRISPTRTGHPARGALLESAEF